MFEYITRKKGDGLTWYEFKFDWGVVRYLFNTRDDVLFVAYVLYGPNENPKCYYWSPEGIRRMSETAKYPKDVAATTSFLILKGLL